MGLFDLFSGKKKEKPAAVAAPTPQASKPVAPVMVVETKPAPAPVHAPVMVAAAEATGALQVKLRLKLAASLRAGQHAKAYEAAKGLADIQARAGRRMAARVWREQAERILERDGQRAA